MLNRMEKWDMASKSAWDGKIPFIAGKPVVYVNSWDRNVEYRDNTLFLDTLRFAYFQRGRSAARAVFKSKTLKCNVEMFLTDLDDAIPLLVEGKLTGTFDFAKRGSNYGIKRVGP